MKTLKITDQGKLNEVFLVHHILPIPYVFSYGDGDPG